jgi:hypothetical protein
MLKITAKLTIEDTEYPDDPLCSATFQRGIKDPEQYDDPTGDRLVSFASDAGLALYLPLQALSYRLPYQGVPLLLAGAVQNLEEMIDLKRELAGDEEGLAKLCEFVEAAKDYIEYRAIAKAEHVAKRAAAQEARDAATATIQRFTPEDTGLPPL